MRLSHIAWNLVGLSLPLAVAAVSVPALMAAIGVERFGLLALAWGLIGYAGALDLGIGRALTQMVSRLLGEAAHAEIPLALSTAGRITLVTGTVGGGLIAFAAIAGAADLIAVVEVSRGEVIGGMLLLAIALPAQAMSATYRGMNEAYQNFKGISLLRIALGVLTFGGPYAVSFFTVKLYWLVFTLVVSRLAALFVYRALAHSCFLGSSHSIKEAAYSWKVGKALFAFGGWVTVSSIVSPMLVQADRYTIASLISPVAVTSYVLPYELVVQTLIVTGAITTSIFPSLSRMLAEGNPNWRAYFNKWLMIVASVMSGVCSMLAFLLQDILTIWIKGALDPQSVTVGQILCVGVFANSIGAMFYALLHAKGRSDITAKLHIIELPLFIFLLLTMIESFGLIGAAIAWSSRMIFDTFALAFFARRECA